MRLVRDAEGWNLGRLVKEQRRGGRSRGSRPADFPAVDRDRRRQRRPSTIGTGSTGYRLPRRIDDLDVQAAFEYEPVHYTVGLRPASASAAPDPEFSAAAADRQASPSATTTCISKRWRSRPPRARSTLDGVIESYLRTPVIKLDDGRARCRCRRSAGSCPALAGYQLHPALARRDANGTSDRLALDLDMKSEAGRRSRTAHDGPAIAGFRVRRSAPRRATESRPNLEESAQRSDITGDVTHRLDASVEPVGCAGACIGSGARSRSAGRACAALGYDGR